MAATDTTVINDFTDFLKEWYLDIIYEERKMRNVFLDDAVIKFDREHVAGKYALIPLEFQSMVGIGNRAENGAMPIPDAGQYDTAKITLCYMYAVMQFSGQLLKASEGAGAAFDPALTRITNTTMNAWLRDLNRQCLGDGQAYLAMVDGSATAHVFDVDNAWGISNTGAGSNGNGDLFLSENMRINMFNSTTKLTDGGAAGDGVIRITAYSRGSGATEATITVDAEGTIADGYYIIRDGNKATGSSSTYEANGLMLLIDDGTLAGTFQNVSTTTRPDFKAWVHYGATPGTAEALTRVRMNQPWKDIVKRGMGKVDFLFCGVDTEETYLELADSMSLTTNPVKLDAAPNWEGPGFRGAPIISDPIYPEGRIEYIDRSAIAIYENDKADWIPGDVGILQKVQGYHNYVAEYGWFWQFGVRNRTKLGSLRDIELVV